MEWHFEGCVKTLYMFFSKFGRVVVHLPCRHSCLPRLESCTAHNFTDGVEAWERNRARHVASLMTQMIM